MKISPILGMILGGLSALIAINLLVSLWVWMPAETLVIKALLGGGKQQGLILLGAAIVSFVLSIFVIIAAMSNKKLLVFAVITVLLSIAAIVAYSMVLNKIIEAVELNNQATETLNQFGIEVEGLFK